MEMKLVNNVEHEKKHESVRCSSDEVTGGCCSSVGHSSEGYPGEGCGGEKSQKPLACDMKTMTPEQRERHTILIQRNKERQLEKKELVDGWGGRYPFEAGMIMDLAEFMTLELLCCPFFSISLEVNGEREEVWLNWTGREGVKEMLTRSMTPKAAA